MRREILFKGNVSQFVNVVRDLQENIFDDYGDFSGKYRYYDYHYRSGDPIARVSFSNPLEEDAAKVGSIKAVEIPNGKARLIVWAPDEYWNELKPYWEWLEDEMRRLGFIERAEAEEAQFTKHLKTKQSKRGQPSKRTKPVPRHDTKRKINNIIDKREQAIQKGWEIPSWSRTVRDCRTDETRVKLHAPELHKNWYDKLYRPTLKDFFPDYTT